MDFYQINDLERLSGIKAHTIRIWEKRYGIITPYRTETNIRYYDNEQLKKLLNVATLVASGSKISRVAALDNASLRTEIKRIQEQHQKDSGQASYINGFIAAMLDFNESAFDRIFDAIIGQYGVYEAIVTVVYPFLHKVGVLWSVNETIPVQEHFASSIIKKKLFSLISALDVAPKSKKLFLLFLPSNEWHELGLLFAEYIIRVHGGMTINLGQNVPSAEIGYVVRKIKPDYLLTFLISDANEAQIETVLEFIRPKHCHTVCLVSGPESKLYSFKEDHNLKILRQPVDILNFL